MFPSTLKINTVHKFINEIDYENKKERITLNVKYIDMPCIFRHFCILKCASMFNFPSCNFIFKFLDHPLLYYTKCS